jgi:putative ABC transport system ATP-binding protein
MSALVKINDVYKIYNAGDNEVRALDGITLNINHGEFVAIIGHSGSGKSTLMNILGCLDTPTKGEYILDGDAVANLSDNQLSDIRNKQIGFIFQGFNLIPALNALENVELPLIYRGLKPSERRKLATEALSRVGLANRRLHRPSELSGGQQQRAAIARAIGARPPIILADEPTGNLDTKSGLEVMNILKELNAEGKTIILITHDKNVAAVAKRIVTLKDGKIISDVPNLPQQESAAGRENEKVLNKKRLRLIRAKS